MLIAPDNPSTKAAPNLSIRSQKKERGAVAVVVAALANPSGKWLRGRVVESGAMCWVLLTERGARAKDFMLGQRLECQPHPPFRHHFSYDSKAAAISAP